MPVAGDPERPSAAQHAFDYFDLWSWDGTLERIHHALYVECREREEREASPTAAIIDSQSVKSAEKGGRASIRMATMRERRSKARSAIILVDTLGLLLSAAVHSADIQDRDGAALVLDERTRALFPFILRIFADAGYQGPRAALAAAETGSWIIEIVKRNELHTFVVLPKRWIVERTIAWLNRCRQARQGLGEPQSQRRSLSCASHQSASCCENFAIQYDVSGQTLRNARCSPDGPSIQGAKPKSYFFVFSK